MQCHRGSSLHLVLLPHDGAPLRLSLHHLVLLPHDEAPSWLISASSCYTSTRTIVGVHPHPSPISLSSLSFLTVRDMIVPRHPCGRQYVYPPHLSRLLNCTYPFAAFPTPRYASQVARRLGGSWRGADKNCLYCVRHTRGTFPPGILPRVKYDCRAVLPLALHKLSHALLSGKFHARPPRSPPTCAGAAANR